MKITVNLVDDHKIVTDELSFVLSAEEDIEVLDIAHSKDMALSQLKQRQPDVILLDHNLDKDDESQNGHEVAKEVLKEYPEIKIMMLTMHNEPEVIVPCVSAGIHGYMLKSEQDADFGSAIRKLHLHGQYFSPSIAKDLALTIRKHTEEKIPLSSREKEVLVCLFKGASTKAIADQLFISTHTVDSHRKNLIQKFEANNSVHLIYLALQKGYLRV